MKMKNSDEISYSNSMVNTQQDGIGLMIFIMGWDIKMKPYLNSLALLWFCIGVKLDLSH
jgi:uncharacterized membrane protein